MVFMRQACRGLSISMENCIDGDNLSKNEQQEIDISGDAFIRIFTTNHEDEMLDEPDCTTGHFVFLELY